MFVGLGFLFTYLFLVLSVALLVCFIFGATDATHASEKNSATKKRNETVLFPNQQTSGL